MKFGRHRLRRPAARKAARPLLALLLGLAGCGALGLAACGSSKSARPQAPPAAPAGSDASALNATPLASRAHPQAIEPTPGEQAVAVGGDTPVGDPNARAPSLDEVKRLLKLQLVAARVTSAHYVNPLQFVNHWGRTDQGVDATMPVGAPILAPSRVKVLATIPNWFAGQPLVYFELLDGPDAGKVQYVAEQITNIAPVGILQQGQAIARFAASGTAIEYGWAILNGQTLASATTGYTEGQVTPAGVSIRAWLNSLGANAGSG